jgi:hypothetical protein
MLALTGKAGGGSSPPDRTGIYDDLVGLLEMFDR